MDRVHGTTAESGSGETTDRWENILYRIIKNTTDRHAASPHEPMQHRMSCAAVRVPSTLFVNIYGTE